MDARGFALFTTPIGRCGIAWSERGVASCQLPERTPSAARLRLLERLAAVGERLDPAHESDPAAHPDHIRAAIEAIDALLRGEPRDLGFIQLGPVPIFSDTAVCVDFSSGRSRKTQA